VAVLKALHAKVNVKFLGGEGGGHRGEKNWCQTEHGDLLGPTLFNFHVAGVLMACKEARKSAPPTLFAPSVIGGRSGSKVAKTVRVVRAAGDG
jgi:hypothetical protein